MKITASIAASLLGCVVLARPRAMDNDGAPLPQKSRITAFVVDENGGPSLECWEISQLVDSMSTLEIRRSDGSKTTAYATTIAGVDNLDGLQILTWPALSPIWPPSDDDTVRAEYYDLADTFNLFNVQGGLINFNIDASRFDANVLDNDDQETHIFSLENGDDWFYFEDNYTGSEAAQSARASPLPFTISTISATETEVMRLRFRAKPKHRVVHKGACSFTGIKTPADASFSEGKDSRAHSPLTVQVHIEESL